MSALPAITALWLAAAAVSGAPPPVTTWPAQPSADPETRADANAEPGPQPDAPDQQGAVEAAFQAAEAMQGPLDGLWRLQDAGGRTLYVFSLSDAGDAPAPLAASPDHPDVEGAWRDPSRPGAPDASGFIDSVRRQGDWLQIRFVDGADRRAETLTLRGAGAGRWRGELAGAGASQPVIMSRF